MASIVLEVQAPYNAPRRIRERLCMREPLFDLDLKIKLVTRWMSWCIGRHTWCKETLAGLHVDDRGTGPPLPTRVIVIRPGKDPFLLESNGRHGHYAALSYCWPRNELPLTTTCSSIHGFYSEIPTKSAPRAIQKAIEVAEKLHIRYLWIDGLSIIQDDEADWEREAAKMSDGYSHAYLTIVILDTKRDAPEAEGSSDNVGHLPHTRWQYIERDTKTGVVRQTCNLHIQESQPGCSQSKLERVAQLSRWNSRAWVCQERILSRRLLYVHRDQFFWECQQEQFSEDGHDNELQEWQAEGSVIGTGDGYTANGDKTAFIRGLVNETELFGLDLRTIGEDSRTDVSPWAKRLMKYSSFLRGRLAKNLESATRKALKINLGRVDYSFLVSDYTSRDLTNPADRPVAFDGLGEAIARRCSSQFYAGVWTHRLANSLYWCAAWNRAAKGSPALQSTYMELDSMEWGYPVA